LDEVDGRDMPYSGSERRPILAVLFLAWTAMVVSRPLIGSDSVSVRRHLHRLIGAEGGRRQDHGRQGRRGAENGSRYGESLRAGDKSGTHGATRATFGSKVQPCPWTGEDIDGELPPARNA
jgi:hypothetical protein